MRPRSSQSTSIRILIAEDHPIARLGIRALISIQSDMKIVGEASDGEQAVALFREYQPDVMVADMRMPVMGGCEAVAAICREFPDARVVALSTYSGDEDIRRALAAGVKAYLSKTVLYDELIKAIRLVHKGGRYLDPDIAVRLESQPARPDLSGREKDVLELIIQGVSNKEIGYTLGIAEYTVKNHVRSILAKLEAEDRTHAATIAIRRGIVHLPQ